MNWIKWNFLSYAIKVCKMSVCAALPLWTALLNCVFIHSVVCLTTGPQPLPKPVLHTVRSSTSSSNFQYPFVSLRSPNSWLCLFHFTVTSIPPSIFPPTTFFLKGSTYTRCDQCSVRGGNIKMEFTDVRKATLSLAQEMIHSCTKRQNIFIHQ